MLVLRVLAQAANLGYLLLGSSATTKLGGGGLNTNPAGCSAALASAASSACVVAALSAGCTIADCLADRSQSLLQIVLEGVVNRQVNCCEPNE